MMDMDVIKMHSRLPVLLAELSRYDKDKAIEYIQHWGEGTKTISVMFEEIVEELDKYKPCEE